MRRDPYAGRQFAVLRLYGLLADELAETADQRRAQDLHLRLAELDSALDRLLAAIPLAEPTDPNSSVPFRRPDYSENL